MKCQIIHSGILPPEQIMAKDAEFLKALQDCQQSILHFYEWEGQCLTYGYFTHPFDYLHREEVEKRDIKIARRPTGGGIIFHLTDLAFSVLVPAGHPHFSINSLENYAFINRIIAEALTGFTHQRLNPQLWTPENCSAELCSSFCMAKPTRYDLVVEGKKIGGAAQRRTKWGYLHQGSLSLSFPSLDLLEQVIKDKSVFEDIQRYTYCLFDQKLCQAEFNRARYAIQKEIENHLVNHLQ